MTNREKHEKMILNLMEEIKDNYESVEECVSELRRYREEFPRETDYNYYMYGNIRPYYSQIFSFYEENGYKDPWRRSCNWISNKFQWDVRIAINRILKEARETKLKVA